MSNVLLENDAIYKGEITGHYIGSTSTDKVYVGIEFKVTHQLNEQKRVKADPDPFDPMPEEAGDIYREVKLWVTPGGKKITKKSLKTLGYDYKDEEGNDSLAALHSSHPKHVPLKGKPIFVRCNLSDYNGEVQENFWVHKFEKPLSDAEELANLNKILGMYGASDEVDDFQFPDYEDLDDEEFDEAEGVTAKGGK